MPVYEYVCGKCGRVREAMQKISDPPLTRCDVCNGRLKRIISQSTFHLKGTGWYVTDYASKSASTNPAGNKAEGAGKAKKASEDSAKTPKKESDE